MGMESRERLGGAATRLVETAALAFEQECSEARNSFFAAGDYIEHAGIAFAE